MKKIAILRRSDRQINQSISITIINAASGVSSLFLVLVKRLYSSSSPPPKKLVSISIINKDNLFGYDIYSSAGLHHAYSGCWEADSTTHLKKVFREFSLSYWLPWHFVIRCRIEHVTLRNSPRRFFQDSGRVFGGPSSPWQRLGKHPSYFHRIFLV